MTEAHIIIVNYNAGEWLSRALDSALRYSDGPVSVVDNASTDDSILQAQKRIDDRRVEWILNRDNRGFAAANNQVLTRCAAPYAVLMNPDCEINAGSLPMILEAFEKESKIGLASARIVNEDGSMQATCRRHFPTPWSALVRMLRLNSWFPNNPRFADFDYGDHVDPNGEVEFVEAISGAFMVVKKEALSSVGLLDEAYFMHCEDLDWCMRFQQQGWKVAFVPRASVMHAKGVSSQSRPIRVLWSLHRGMSRFFDKFYRQQYAWPLRWFVKFGIYLSFIARACLSKVRR